MGTARARVALLLFQRKDGRLRLIFDTREANHHFAPPPYTPLAGSQSLSSLQLPAGAALFRHRVVFTSFGHGTGWGLVGDGSLVWRQLREKHLPRWLQSCVNTSMADVVWDSNCWWVPIGWNPKSGLHSRCWNTSCRSWREDIGTPCPGSRVGC